MSTREEWPNSPLATGTAAAVIRASFPSVDSTDVRYIGSGTLYDVFLTKDGWAFRFPRWNWSGDLFEPEARTHQFVAQILPTQIRLPRVELLASPAVGFPYPIAGHRYIPGVGADEVDEELLPTLAREIAMLLTRLHSTPAPEAGAAGIHQMDMTEPGRQEWWNHGIAVAAELRGRDPVIDRAVTWVSTRPAIPATDGSLHLIHGGLEARHVLVNPATGSLVGVIDWTDAQLGDAARDFVFLVTWQGWRFAEEVLRLYPRTLDKAFRARLRYMAQMLSVIELGYTHEQGRDTGKHVRAVHNAFASADVNTG
jgi:aminoglycoside phosphotransferase (APT) family kinase protein